MSTNRQVKEKAVADLTEKLSRAKGALVAQFAGLDVATVSEVRRKFREARVEYKVVKNTLMQRALAGSSIEKLGAAFVGPTAIAFKYDEEFGTLGKAAKELASKFEKFKIKGGYIQDDVLPAATAMETMASLPTLDEARAMLLGVFNAPAGRLLAQINAPATNLLGVIDAKREKDEKAA